MSEPEITEDDVARYWDVNAGPWAEEVRQGHDVAREWLNNPAFLAFVGDLRARAGARMTGVDLSERMIELATAEERRAPLGIRYLRTSYAELGMLADASFDAVVSFMALMDGPRLGEALREVFRVLRPGGLLAFSITHPCFIIKGSHWNYNEAGEKVSWVVSEYFNHARRIDEPRPSEAYCQAHPSQRGWRDHAGLFLYVRAEKPRATTLTQEASR